MSFSFILIFRPQLDHTENQPKVNDDFGCVAFKLDGDGHPTMSVGCLPIQKINVDAEIIANIAQRVTIRQTVKHDVCSKFLEN